MRHAAAATSALSDWVGITYCTKSILGSSFLCAHLTEQRVLSNGTCASLNKARASAYLPASFVLTEDRSPHIFHACYLLTRIYKSRQEARPR